ncbi:AAA family ATPase [Aliarcobacter butzleri]|uniref:AAA family ATPase n=1 Tax=Aliarcobacter butzleri TaxID=28197 RepID=UPI003B20BAA8
MELVYLWVQSYKNIEKQGFNFSPRFRCEYDEEKNELTINENKDYVSIFPDNINITAIVGENGSGKSNILELLPYGGKIQNVNSLIFLLFKKADEFILLKPSSKKIKIDKNFEKKIKKEDIIKFDFSTSNEIKLITYDSDFTKENFIDKDIKKYFENITKFGFSYKEKYLQDNNKILNIEKYKHISNLLTYILKDELIFLDIFFRPTYIKISNYDKSYTNLKIDEIIEKLKNKEFIDQLEINKDLLKQLKYNQKIAINELDKIKILFELPIQDHFYIDFYNEMDISFSEFSQGERSFYNHFLFLMFINKNHSESKENENTFFLIDEPDTTFHPNWQRKYVSQLLNIYKNYKKNIHLIITSHSPFILSDIPKANVIFLEKDEKTGNCKNVSNRIDINPFGANIHTLLSHGFFMKDGLMGEFAKEKIDLAIKYLNQKILTEDELNYCENIISIIGEPIIKRELQKMLDSKRLSEIDLIKKQIAELQKELDKKENKK